VQYVLGCQLPGVEGYLVFEDADKEETEHPDFCNEMSYFYEIFPDM
jgi:hypothetical protein